MKRKLIYSDGQQYQKNKQSPLTSNHWAQKRPGDMALEIQVLTWDRHKIMAELKQLMGSPNDTRKLDIKHKQNMILSNYYLFISYVHYITHLLIKDLFIEISSKVNIYDM
jgi:hypothetical protein